MKTRPRLNSVFVGVFCSTFWPSSVTTDSGPSGPRGIHPARRYRFLRHRFERLGPRHRTHDACARLAGYVPTVALMRPACSMRSGADRERAVGDSAFEAIERPRRFLFAQEAPAAVERARGQLHGAARLEDELSRRHLHVCSGSFAGHRRLVRRPSGRLRRLFRADGVNGVARHEEHAAARNGSAGEHLFSRALPIHRCCSC